MQRGRVRQNGGSGRRRRSPALRQAQRLHHTGVCGRAGQGPGLHARAVRRGMPTSKQRVQVGGGGAGQHADPVGFTANGSTPTQGVLPSMTFCTFPVKGRL